ncbi:uncharacterized protein LOC135849379 [Planococcus citri]|uniref:uncharacterized protein LOC135849379 n=1 Tax=Planococcus citri TaxID=170843 RepID=UPI0031F842F0
MLFNAIFIIGTFIFIKADAANYIGCYETTLNSKLLYQHVKIDDKLTPNSCLDVCRLKNWPYAGLQENVCRCGQNKPPELVKLSDKDCDHPCPGDGNAKCGRVQTARGSINASSIYETGIIAPGQNISSASIFLGCYKNATSTPISLYGPQEEFSETNSPIRCHERCYQQGFRYFTLSGDDCTCGDDLPLEGLAPSYGDHCGKKCKGDKNEYCGSAFELSFYATGIPNIPEYGRFVGCFKNTKVDDIKPEVKLDLPQSNSNQRCLNICDQKGFSYAAVQSGTLCLCMNQPPNSILRKNDLVCEKEDCSGEITKKCGSEDSMKVFKTRRAGNAQEIKHRYVGCFKDQHDYRDLHELRIVGFHKLMTIELCIETCKLKGYAFSSLVIGSQCVCSQLFPSVNEKVSSDDCRYPCEGNKKEKCGGRDIRAVYNNGLPYPRSYSQYFYLGCYEDIEEEKLVTNKAMKVQLNNLSPTICHRHCLKLGFKFFGLTLQPKVCFCSDEQPPEDLRYTDSFKSECPAKYRYVIFSTGLVYLDPDQTYKGCFRVDKTMLNKQIFYALKTLTPKRCLMLCDMLGYLYSAVNQGWDCHCGNTFSDGIPQANEEKCDIRCPGDSLQTCGGSESHMKVYRTSVTNVFEEPKIDVPAEKLGFSETFNILDPSVWSYTIKMPQDPDYEFVTYDKSDQVVYLKQNKLFIKPKIQSENYVGGAVTLKDCTGKPGIECTKKAANYYILPPVLSGQINTNNSFSFKYGKIDIRAKLPIGDWIVPEIWLMPKKNEYGDYYQSGQIRIAMIRGNNQFECSNNDFGHKRLEMGVYLGPEFDVKSKVFYKMAPESWTKEYHNYTVIWSADKISFLVDGEELGTIQPGPLQTIRDIVGLPKESEYIYSGSSSKLAPFDKEFYISLGLSVGGLSNFPDTCTSNPKKPWANTSPKAMLNFWQGRNQWKNTWKDEDSALKVESVNVGAL